MISMNRFLMFFPLTAILKSTLIHSLPQGLFDPENSPLISSNPGRAPAPVVNTDTFDINDDNHSDYTVITSDIFSIAEKPENTKKTCLNKSDLEDDELVCPMNISPQGVDQSSPGTTAKPERENDRVPGEPKTPAPKDQKCKLDPWKLHLCGWGPESDAGRNNIPGYFHRRLVGNLFRRCPTAISSSFS